MFLNVYPVIINIDLPESIRFSIIKLTTYPWPPLTDKGMKVIYSNMILTLSNFSLFINVLNFIIGLGSLHL